MVVRLYDVIDKLMSVYDVNVTEFSKPYGVKNIDGGFREKLYSSFEWNTVTEKFKGILKEKTLYIVNDIFDVYYAGFVLSAEKAIVIGPCRLSGVNFDERRYAQKGFTRAEINTIRQYVLTIPHIHEDVIMHQIKPLLSLTSDNNIEVQYIQENSAKDKNYNQFSFIYSHELKEPDRNKVERRYSVENEVMDAVSQGNIEKARKAIKTLMNTDDISERYVYSPTAQKKSLIVMNTLLRKAVEKANVNPYYLDEISYRYFQKIDYVGNMREQIKLMDEMLKSYCEYAKKYSVEKYSPLVQKTFNYIQLHITDKLTLEEIAEKCQVSASHLTRQFHAETGRSVVDSINHIRISQAANMLKETTLSIAQISARVGINDTNYFSRLFKKYMNCSPTEYRG